MNQNTILIYIDSNDEKKKKSLVCPFKEQPIRSHVRMQCLLVLEDVLRNFYVPFTRRVNESYSDQEKKLLVRIIKLLIFRIEGRLFKPCLFCKSVQCDFILYFCVQDYFRIALPAECPFSIIARTQCLYELFIKLKCFFASQTDLCSVRERKILSRAKRILVHQLKDTPEYDLFKEKHESRTVDQEELRKQKKDEQRMKNICLFYYNPLSKKYKSEKEQLLLRMKKKSSSP